jgi:hypothetical protein
MLELTANTPVASVLLPCMPEPSNMPDGERLDRDVRGAAIVEVVAIPHALSACAKN